MINIILTNSCQELRRRIQLGRKEISGKELPDVVHLAYDWAIQTLNNLEKEVARIEGLLKRNLNDRILQQTWYSELSLLSNDLEVIDKYFLHPLYRLRKQDLLALKIIQWLHTIHPITADKPFIVSNGSFSIASSDTAPTLYWLPVTSETSFLHLPLLFHEFGHELFVNHKDEMEDLIREFQQQLSDFLQPVISQSDDRFTGEIERAADIVETWREWMEELFCDAVGLTIGGETYLLAFSYFIRLGGIKEFHVPQQQLSKRSHPVTLLRIRLLADRARNMNLSGIANAMEEEWMEMADILETNEDYYGYFEESFKNNVVETIDDMLTQADPVPWGNHKSDEEGGGKDYRKLIADAWRLYLEDTANYTRWEQSQLQSLLT